MIEVYGASLAMLIEDKQCPYERFKKMDHLNSRWETEDVYKFLTTCKELLEIVSLAESYSIRYVTL